MALPAGGLTLEASLEALVRFEEAGLDAAWCPQLFGVDALTMFAMAGSLTERIEFGTAVIPRHTRHPLPLASQALTTQAATNGRLRLGIGSSHRDLVEGVLGADYSRPAEHLGEYLSVLPRLLRSERFRHDGPRLTVDTTTAFGRAHVPGASAPPVYVGTMFPMSLAIAGHLADGVITWLVGPRTLETEIVPIVRGAAAEAERPVPHFVAGIPIAVCSAADTEAERERVDRALGRYTMLPVYERVLAREGVAGPASVGAIGDEQTVLDRLAEFAAAGIDEVYGVCFGDEPTLHRTAEFLGGLARRNPS